MNADDTTPQTRFRANDIVKTYGGLTAVNVCELELRSNEIVGLIGPNGAGKSTFVDCVTGFVPVTHGRFGLDGHDVTGARPDQLVKRGLSRTFQLLELFEDLPVRSHLDLAAADGAAVTDLLERLNLDQVADQQASSLSHGQRQMLALARALISSPSVLLLDEPASGMDTNQRATFEAVCRDFVAGGGALMVIDHDIRLIFDLCDRIYVLALGELIAEGSPAAVARDPRVIKAYLGSSQPNDPYSSELAAEPPR